MAGMPDHSELERRIQEWARGAAGSPEILDNILQMLAVYQAITVTSGVGFFIADAQGQVKEVNEAYIRRSGFTREELLKMRITDLEAIELDQETRQRIKQISERGFDRFLTKHRAKNGEAWSAEISISWWDGSGGRLFIFVQDISDRVQAQRALERSEEK